MGRTKYAKKNLDPIDYMRQKIKSKNLKYNFLDLIKRKY